MLKIERLLENMIGKAVDKTFLVIHQRAGKKFFGEQAEPVASGDGFDLTGSYEDLRRKIRDALKEAKKFGEFPSIVATFKDKVFIEVCDSMLNTTRYFEIEYSLGGDKVKITNEKELEKKVEYVLKEWLESISKQPERSFEEEKLRRDQRLLAGLGTGEPPNKVYRGMLTDNQIEMRSLCLDESFEGIEILEAKWSQKMINDLPDDCFAFIKPGGKKDVEKKTVPRSLRYLPYKGADGRIDLPHLRNALARLSQTDLSDDEKKKAEVVLRKAAKEMKIGEFREQTITEDQKATQRALCLDEVEAIKDSRDNFIEVRKKLRDILRETKNNGEISVIWTTEGKALCSVYDPTTSRDTKFLEVSYVLEGEKIRITNEKDVSKGVDVSLKSV
jgi:predicted phosphatase